MSIEKKHKRLMTEEQLEKLALAREKALETNRIKKQKKDEKLIEEAKNRMMKETSIVSEKNEERELLKKQKWEKRKSELVDHVLETLKHKSPAPPVPQEPVKPPVQRKAQQPPVSLQLW